MILEYNINREDETEECFNFDDPLDSTFLDSLYDKLWGISNKSAYNAYLDPLLSEQQFIEQYFPRNNLKSRINK